MHHASWIYHKHAPCISNLQYTNMFGELAQLQFDSVHVRLDMFDKSVPALLGSMFPSECFIFFLAFLLAAPLAITVRTVNLPKARNCDRGNLFPFSRYPWVPLPASICRHRGGWPLQNLLRSSGALDGHWIRRCHTGWPLFELGIFLLCFFLVWDLGAELFYHIEKPRKRSTGNAPSKTFI